MKLQCTTLTILLAGAIMTPFAFGQEDTKPAPETKPAPKPKLVTNGAASVEKIGEKIRAANGGSPQAEEIVKMSQAGVDEKTIVTYIENLPATRVKADDIIYLHDKGISNTIISSWVQHATSASAAQAAQVAAAAAPGAQTAPMQTVAAVAPTTPTPVYIQQSPPVYVSSPSVVYTTPSYYYGGYPYYYGGYRSYSPYYYSRPYFSVGFSTHFGHPFHHFGHGGLRVHHRW